MARLLAACAALAIMQTGYPADDWIAREKIRAGWIWRCSSNTA